MKVLVTGTSQGIGKAIALKFLSEGHEVIGFDLKEATINHPSYHHYVQDVRGNLPAIDGINILINNAGIQSMNEDDIEVNLLGSIRVTKKYAFQKEIKSVLFIASASARSGAEFPEYAASKGGLVAYMKNVAQEISKFGATANSISPGGVLTNINDHIIKDSKLYDAVLNETLLHRWSSVEEIAEWAYFITVVNKSMTAQDILIDNGEFNKFNFIW